MGVASTQTRGDAKTVGGNTMDIRVAAATMVPVAAVEIVDRVVRGRKGERIFMKMTAVGILALPAYGERAAAVDEDVGDVIAESWSWKPKRGPRNHSS